MRSARSRTAPGSGPAARGIASAVAAARSSSDTSQVRLGSVLRPGLVCAACCAFAVADCCSVRRGAFCAGGRAAGCSRSDCCAVVLARRCLCGLDRSCGAAATAGSCCSSAAATFSVVRDGWVDEVGGMRCAGCRRVLLRATGRCWPRRRGVGGLLAVDAVLAGAAAVRCSDRAAVAAGAVVGRC
jgi:hypothetical protein